MAMLNYSIPQYQHLIGEQKLSYTKEILPEQLPLVWREGFSLSSSIVSISEEANYKKNISINDLRC